MCLALTACGGGGGGVSFHDYYAKLIQARCAYQVTCGQAPDSATCTTTSLDPTVYPDVVYETMAAAITAGKVTFDGDAAQRCVDSIAAASCEIPGAQPTQSDLDCLDVYHGTVAMGGNCLIDQECVEGYLGACQVPAGCQGAESCCVGQCTGPLVYQLPIGASCTDIDFEMCTIGSYCSGENTGTNGFHGICAAPIATEGAACDVNSVFDGCANPMYCDSTTATCKTPAAHGAACDAQASPSCRDDGDFCDPSSHTCIAGLAAGNACPMGTTCAGTAECINNTCVAKPKVGEACTPDGPSCYNASGCTNGTCQVPPPPVTPPMACPLS